MNASVRGGLCDGVASLTAALGNQQLYLAADPVSLLLSFYHILLSLMMGLTP